MRAKILKDEVSALNQAKEEGQKEKAIEVARNLLNMGIEAEKVTKVTGLSRQEVEDLMEV